MQEPISTRRATADDLDAIVANLMAGFQTFAEFAPAGWAPPEPRPEVTAEILARPDTWALLADDSDGAMIGHVSFTPARGEPFDQPGGRWRERPPVPGKAHLWQLFVRPSHWGRRVAARLHDAATGEMAARGYERARLFTPAANRRSRAFYERRGWTYERDGPDPDLGLRLVEYSIELSPGRAPPGPRQP